MANTIKEIYNLQGLWVTSNEVKKEEIVINVRGYGKRSLCPTCGKHTKRLYDTRTRRIRHDVHNGRKVYLMATQRRFLCCSKVHTEYLHGISRKRSTKHFRAKTVSSAQKLSFSAVAGMFGVSAPSVIQSVRESADLISEFTGTRLCLDEHSFSGRNLKATIGDPDQGSVLAILSSASQAEILKHFKTYTHAPTEVCIDMCMRYIKAIREAFPRARIVVDQFHVIKLLNHQIDEMRKILIDTIPKGRRKGVRYILMKNIEDLSHEQRVWLDEVFAHTKQYPALRALYRTKEYIRTMYRYKNKDTARQHYERVITALEGLHQVGIVREVCDTLKRWKEFILNFFDSRLTNAFIEGCHNKIKLIKRISFGFRNFENYKAKVRLAFAQELCSPL